MTRMRAEQLPLGTQVRVRTERLTLRLEHGRKPWRAVGGRGRFSHAEVNGSLEAGEAEVLAGQPDDVAAV